MSARPPQLWWVTLAGLKSIDSNTVQTGFPSVFSPSCPPFSDVIQPSITVRCTGWRGQWSAHVRATTARWAARTCLKVRECAHALVRLRVRRLATDQNMTEQWLNSVGASRCCLGFRLWLTTLGAHESTADFNVTSIFHQAGQIYSFMFLHKSVLQLNSKTGGCVWNWKWNEKCLWITL